MQRSRSYRRHQRRRLIHRRTRILLNAHQAGFRPRLAPWKWLDFPGILGKCNLQACSCPGCSPWRYDRRAAKADARRRTDEQLDDG